MRAQALSVLRGALMGCAEVVPGISGGTVALIVGVYERLLASLRIAISAGVAIARLDLAKARDAARRVDWGLILPLLVGMSIALLIGSSVIPPLLERHPEESSALFFGLIIASLAVPWRMSRKRRPHHLAVALAAAGMAFVLTGFPEREVTDPALPLVFVAAAVAICALTLPGVSGSYLLLAMGLYVPTLDAVAARDVVYLAVFAAGAAAGLAVFARVLTTLLHRYRDITVAGLLGLMVGSLRALWPWTGDQGALQAPPSETAAAVPAAMALVGIAIVTTLLLLTRQRELSA